jgi:hypothetical protein
MNIANLRMSKLCETTRQASFQRVTLQSTKTLHNQMLKDDEFR